MAFIIGFPESTDKASFDQPRNRAGLEKIETIQSFLDSQTSEKRLPIGFIS
jgi:hypothetical protein